MNYGVLPPAEAEELHNKILKRKSALRSGNKKKTSGTGSKRKRKILEDTFADDDVGQSVGLETVTSTML